MAVNGISLLLGLAVSSRPWPGPELDGEAAAARRGWRHVLAAGRL